MGISFSVYTTHLGFWPRGPNRTRPAIESGAECTLSGACSEAQFPAQISAPALNSICYRRIRFGFEASLKKNMHTGTDMTDDIGLDGYPYLVVGEGRLLRYMALYLS